VFAAATRERVVAHIAGEAVGLDAAGVVLDNGEIGDRAPGAACQIGLILGRGPLP